MAFHKAEKRKAKLRLGITGPAGSGKTYGALLVAMGLGGKIALIDTENGSGDLYSDLGEYYVEPIEAPYTVQKYLAAINAAEQAGFDVLIIDSLSHAWAGEGGLLDQQGKIADSGRGNSYTAWRQVTPWHNKLVEAILTSKCHIIATMRSKTEYIQEQNDKGKTVIRKVGLAPVQRDGMEYEFGIVFDLSATHTASVSKDRTSLFDGQVFTLSKETGEKLKAWLESGVDVPAPTFQSSPVAAPQPTPHKPTRAEHKNRLYHGYLDFFDGDTKLAQEAMLLVTEGRGSKDWTDEDMAHMGADLAQKYKAKTAHPTIPPEVLDQSLDKVANE